MSRISALQGSGHFIAEKPSKPYRWYGTASIAGKKCAIHQERPNKFRLFLSLEGRGA